MHICWCSFKISKSFKMYQNLVMTGLTPVWDTNEIQNWDNRPFNGRWPENRRSTVQGTKVTKPRKKPKRFRTNFTTDQLYDLEKTYSVSKYINVGQRKELAETLNICEKSIKVWFQNRRMKAKREFLESSSDTSSEIMSSVHAPLAPSSSDQNNRDPNGGFRNTPISNYKFQLATSQPVHCEVPSFKFNENVPGMECQNGYCSCWQNGNDAYIGVDSNVYSTQNYSQYTSNEGQFHDISLDANGQAQYSSEMGKWYASLLI